MVEPIEELTPVYSGYSHGEKQEEETRREERRPSRRKYTQRCCMLSDEHLEYLNWKMLMLSNRVSANELMRRALDVAMATDPDWNNHRVRKIDHNLLEELDKKGLRRFINIPTEE